METKENCTLCGHVGIYTLKDIEVFSKNDIPLDKRLDKNPRVKRLQMQHYGNLRQRKEVTKKGFSKTVKEYYVMGQNVTTMSAVESADALLDRDANKFKNLPNYKDEEVGPLFVPATYVPSTQVVSPEDLDEVLHQNPDKTKLQVEVLKKV